VVQIFHSEGVDPEGDYTINLNGGTSGAGGSGNGAGMAGETGPSSILYGKFGNIVGKRLSFEDNGLDSAGGTMELDACFLNSINFDGIANFTITGTGYSSLGSSVTAGNGAYDWTP
jgi:hypothetical protein